MGGSGDDRLVFFAVVGTVVLTVALAALLPAHRGAPSTSGLADRDPTCAEWTDGCVTCLRTPQGPSCSTPGIACVRQRPECLRKQGG